jgi:chemotaxis protein methyltransferase CheR
MEERLHQHAIPIITRLLRERTGQVLSDDRSWRIDRAIEAVLRKRGIAHSHDLITLLTQPDSEAMERDLIEALLNNETYFFRDRQIFDHLGKVVLPSLAKARQASRSLSIWSAGCSTGQEALSLAMLLSEQASSWAGWSIRILATDISTSAIETARRATYSKFEIQRGLAVGQMLQNFEETPHGWRASSALSKLVRFEVHNLLNGPPGGQMFDLILCRNLMLYFDEESKRLACQKLASAMAPHSYLLLGGGETIVDPRLGFASASRDCGLYRLAGQSSRHHAAA